MRNFGLALVLIATVIAPHAALAKKHGGGKKGRSAKSQRHLKRAHQTRGALAQNSHDALADVVTKEKSEPKPVLTAVAARPAPQPVQEPARPNAPMSMDNQSNDDEVPGARKKR